MERDNKLILGAVLVLLIAMVSFNVVNGDAVTGNAVFSRLRNAIGLRTSTTTTTVPTTPTSVANQQYATTSTQLTQLYNDLCNQVPGASSRCNPDLCRGVGGTYPNYGVCKATGRTFAQMCCSSTTTTTPTPTPNIPTPTTTTPTPPVILTSSSQPPILTQPKNPAEFAVEYNTDLTGLGTDKDATRRAREAAQRAIDNAKAIGTGRCICSGWGIVSQECFMRSTLSGGRVLPGTRVETSIREDGVVVLNLWKSCPPPVERSNQDIGACTSNQDCSHYCFSELLNAGKAQCTPFGPTECDPDPNNFVSYSFDGVYKGACVVK